METSLKIGFHKITKNKKCPDRGPGHHENEFYNSLTKTYTRNLAINVPNIYSAKLIYPQR
jgi:hypothetical protein